MITLIGFATLAFGQVLPACAQKVGPTASSSSGSNEDRATLETLNSDWLTAYKTSDRAALDRILADDFVAVYPEDRVLRKADLMAAATGTSRTVETVSWDRLRIMVFGDVAVVTARSHLTGVAAGKSFDASNDYADVYAKRHGRWQAVSAHVVRAAPAP
ncbi:nuclear transport factor 2 family protein [Sphingomonas sp. CJ20]